MDDMGERGVSGWFVNAAGATSSSHYFGRNEGDNSLPNRKKRNIACLPEVLLFNLSGRWMDANANARWRSSRHNSARERQAVARTTPSYETSLLQKAIARDGAALVVQGLVVGNAAGLVFPHGPFHSRHHGDQEVRRVIS